MFRKNFSQITLKEVMTTPVFTIDVQAPFSAVEEKMRVRGIRHLPVVDQAGKLVGLVTERDLFKVHSPRKLEDGGWFYDKDALDQFILSYVMLKDPFTLTLDDPILDALVAMVRFKYGCVPIVDQFRIPCGIVTKEDMLKVATEYLSGKKISLK